MEKQPDDLEAVRGVVKALEGFKAEDQERIIRWAREKVGLSTGDKRLEEKSAVSSSVVPPASTDLTSTKTVDINTFVASKNPVSDSQFVATVAYYYQFVAPVSERKDSIRAEDLLEACRKVNRERFKYPAQTLVNTYSAGLLDKTGSGAYRINAVGENLVAMTLPGGKDIPLKKKLTKKVVKTKAKPIKRKK